MGGKIKTLDHVRITEMPSKNGSHLLGPRFFTHDRGYLDYLWSAGNNRCNKFRKVAVESYEDKDLTGVLHLNEQ